MDFRKIIIICMILISGMLHCQEYKPVKELTLQGELINYKWSKDSRFLAVLYTDPDEVYTISIIKTWNGRIAKTRTFPFRVSSFDWMEDDKSLLLARASENYTFELLSYGLVSKKFISFDEKIQRALSGVSSINIAPHTNFWAVTTFAEGLVATQVFRNDVTNFPVLLQAEVYGGVYGLFWHGGLLYCQSFVDLEIGLDEEVRLAWFKAQGMGQEAEYYNSDLYIGNTALLFGVDVLKMQAYHAHETVQNEMHYSYDRHYYTELIQQTNQTFTVRIFHSIP